MIEEDYVNFEIAKLLEEKEYCNISTIFYKENGEMIQYNVPLNNKGISDTLGVFYEAPTLQMAVKWLREVHDLFIGVEYVNILGLGYVYQVTIYRFGDNNMCCLYEKSYEKVVDSAIKYCLENLV